MNFFKTFLAALLAIVVANILMVIFFVMLFAGAVAVFDRPPTSVGSGSVLRIDFTHGVTDSPDNLPFSAAGIFDGVTLNMSNSLAEVLDAIDNAAYDPRIRGIYINITGGSISLANIEEVRAALQEFKDMSAGKFVIAYSESYSQMAYYLSSVADKVFIHPEGGLAWHGVASQVMFYKGMFDKLGIDVEIFRHGSFKSGVEPFMLDRMSPESKSQLNIVMGSIWDMVLDDVSKSRGVEKSVLSDLAANLSVRGAESAVRYGLADAALYHDQVVGIMAGLTGGTGSLDSELAGALSSGNGDGDSVAVARIAHRQPVCVTINDYINDLKGRMVRPKGDQIGVIYIDGDIVDGKGGTGSAGSAEVVEKLERARRNNSVKGVVVRVNSPGGSALASDVMWREMELLRKEKPLIVSMGGYAASGGYYVSCPADMILADRSTITGSIGVFGLLPNVEKGLRDKIGITTDVVTTEPHADLGSPFRPMRQSERDYITAGIEKVYATFVGHVAAGRNMTVDAVDAIAEGRVWSGRNAVDIGLADGIGGLSEAVKLCADRAGVANSYYVKEIVDDPDMLTILLRSLSSSAAGGVRSYRDGLGELFMEYRSMRNMIDEPGIQARMPFALDIR